MTPRKVSIGELLGEYERRPIILPEFQRPYSWEKTQVATFWGDLKTFRDRYAEHPIDAAYFLGPVVVMETKQEITVLDGQQRLATATILLAAIRDIARECYGSSNYSELDYLARDVQRELIEKKDTAPLVYSLKLGELDEPFFLQTIKSDPPARTKSRLREVTPVFWTGRDAKIVVEQPTQKPGETHGSEAEDTCGGVQSAGGRGGNQRGADTE